LIGNGTVTANPTLLLLNNATLGVTPNPNGTGTGDPTIEATANCTATINSGGIYYSAATASANGVTTNELRGCINGTWTDIVTADQLGVMLFGVVQDSGTTPGDLTGAATGYDKAPCKVSWASATSVSVAPCIAYSSGRKVVVPNTVTISGLGTAGSVRFQHICLSGTNGEPDKTATNTTETANVPAFNAQAPILCLATVKLSTTPAITNIYDTRIFTTSIKEFATATTPTAPGMVVIPDTTGDNMVKTTSATGASNVRGVVAAGSSAGSTTSINTIIVVGGPAFVKATGTVTLGLAVHTATTAGYASSAALNQTGNFKDIGQILGNGNTTACNAQSNCQFSIFTDVGFY
jgi:hypothetical protein